MTEYTGTTQITADFNGMSLMDKLHLIHEITIGGEWVFIKDVTIDVEHPGEGM